MLKTALLVSGLITIAGFQALACSCAGWANAQQAAQTKGAIIARVKTLELSENGLGRLQVQKVYKGKMSLQTVTVFGQDGVNCNGELRGGDEPWVVLMIKSQGKYQTVACADTALPVDPATDKITVTLGEEIHVSETEFKKIIANKVMPTVKGLQCSVGARRNVVPFDHPSAARLTFEYRTDVTSANAGDLRVSAELDLSNSGPRLGTLNVDAQAAKKSSTRYELKTQLIDPFFAETRVASGEIDLKKPFMPISLSIDKYTDLEGDPHREGEKPFLAHDTYADCSLTTGAPLVPVR